MATNDSTAPRNGDVPKDADVIMSTSPESMLELRQELAELAHTLPGDLRRLRVRGGDREIEVEWVDQASVLEQGVAQRSTRPAETTGRLAPASPPVPDTPPVPDEQFTPVRAPLVGCYYAAPSPGAEPFVQVGDTVDAGTTVAIIEAMKLMNTIVAGESGVVAEVLVSNGESVEYDQVLLHLRPAEQAA